MRRGIIYSRVSTESQDYNKQIDELKEYAKRNDIEIINIYAEKASGFNDGREEYKKVKQLTKEDVDIILIWELSRLSRNAIELQIEVRDFVKKGIDLYFKKEELHTLDANGKEVESTGIIISLLSKFAEGEAKTLKQRTRSGRIYKVKNENHSYAVLAPYGYDYDKTTKRLIINDIEADVVKRMFQLSLDGYSQGRIMSYLNSEGIPTKLRKNRWTTGTVKNVLTNSVYTGKAKYSTRITKEDEKSYIEIETPVIIDEETFYHNREVMMSRKLRSKSAYTKHNPLLRSLIECTECGRKYAYKNCLQIYACARMEYQHTCKAKTISAPKLEYIVWDIVKTYFRDKLSANKAEEAIKPIRAEIENYISDIKKYEKRIEEIDKEASSISRKADYIAFEYPEMTNLYYDELKKIKPLNDERKKRNLDINDLNKKVRSKENQIKNIISGSKKTNLADTIIDEQEKYDIVHESVDNIKIYRGENKYSIIVITLTTGYQIYVGYIANKYKNYYVVIYPNHYIQFDEEKRKGYLIGLDKDKIEDGQIKLSFKEIKTEYSIKDFIQYFESNEELRRPF